MHFEKSTSKGQNAVTTNSGIWLTGLVSRFTPARARECFPISILILNPAGLATYSKGECTQGGAPGMKGGRHSKACKASQHIQKAERNLVLHSRKMHGRLPHSRHLKCICLYKRKGEEKNHPIHGHGHW